MPQNIWVGSHILQWPCESGTLPKLAGPCQSCFSSCSNHNRGSHLKRAKGQSPREDRQRAARRSWMPLHTPRPSRSPVSHTRAHRTEALRPHCPRTIPHGPGRCTYPPQGLCCPSTPQLCAPPTPLLFHTEAQTPPSQQGLPDRHLTTRPLSLAHLLLFQR